MKIKTLNYKNYGRLKEVSVDFDPKINVVYGDNEAGKSTIFNSIKTLMYGFSPANRDKHPYTAWASGDIVFSGLVSHNNQETNVERQLKSSPKVNLIDTTTGQVQTLRNDALPFISDVSEGLYDAIFHLTAEDLLVLEDDSWEHIQEKLIFNFGVDYLNKTGDVIGDIEKEINELWRPDKRGNPKIIGLEKEIRNLKKQKSELESAYDDLMNKTQTLETLKSELDHNQTQRKAKESHLQNLRSLKPIKDKVERVKWLRDQMISSETFSQIPQDIESNLRQINRQIEDLSKDYETFEAQYHALEQQVNNLSDEDQVIFANSETVLGLEAKLKTLETNEERLSDVSRRLTDLHSQMADQFHQIFEGNIPFDIELIKPLNPLKLKSDLYKYIEKQDKNESEAQKMAEASVYKQKENQIVLGVSLLVLILMIVVIPHYLVFAGWLPVLVIGYAIANLLKGKVYQGTLYDVEAIKKEIAQTVSPMTLPDYAWEDRSYILVNRVEKLVGAVNEYERLSSEKLELMAKDKAIREALYDSLSFMSLDHSRDAKLTYNMLKVRLDQINKQNVENDKIIIKIGSIEASLTKVKDKLSQLESDKEALINYYSVLGEGDIEEGKRRFDINKQYWEKIKVLEDELLLVGPLLDQLKNRRETDPISDDYLAQEQELLSQMLDSEKTLLIQKTNLEGEIRQLKENVAIDVIDSQILMLTEEVAVLTEKRNRLMVLAEVIKFADELYRKENQPDILKYVSQYMAIMTDGKYSEVLIDEQYRIMIMVSGEIKTLETAFSKGTINQLFLAFRLAFIKMLSEGKSSLPIVFDEAFINWDIHRMAKTKDLLDQFSKDHQIFIFTCHQWLADHFDGKTIQLN